jgi:glycerate 2-kinase
MMAFSWRRLSLRSFSCLLLTTNTRPRLVSSFQLQQQTLLFTRLFSSQTPKEAQMTHDSKEIYQAAIHAVDPVVAVQNQLKYKGGNIFQMGSVPIDLTDYDTICITAFGKASSSMATAVLDRLLECPLTTQKKLAGIVIVKDNHATPEQVQQLASHDIRVQEAAHPVPDQRGVAASVELMELVQNHASQRTLIMACISGGGSALFCAPQSPLTLEDLQATNKVLLGSGWGIQDMNIVRKRLEQGKGGKLARVAHPGRLVSFILSDVLGDPLDLIASGPTVPDTSTWQNAWDLVSGLPPGSLPDSVMTLLQQGKENSQGQQEREDTSRVFENTSCCLVGNTAVAVTAAAQQAIALGYQPVILGTQIQGEAKEVAKVLVGMAQYVQTQHTYSMAKLPAAIISGGETTVSLADSCGKGGRNQELGLAAAHALKVAGLRQIVICSIGTDGSDGPTDAAGALVDGGTMDRLGVAAGIKALEQHNAYPYLSQVDKDGVSPLIKVRL